jgi:hypothetical protein
MAKLRHATMVLRSSDLAVSGILPVDKAACLAQISPSPYSVTT